MWLQLGNETVNLELIQAVEYITADNTIVLKGVNGTYLSYTVPNFDEIQTIIKDRLTLINKRKRQWTEIGNTAINLANMKTISRDNDTLTFIDIDNVNTTKKVGIVEAKDFINKLP